MHRIFRIFIVVLHSLVLLITVTSPFWIDWKIVVFGYLLYELQLYLFKGCILSFAEFGVSDKKPRERFIIFYLAKLFPKSNNPKFKVRVGNFLDNILAPAVPSVALIVQLLFNMQPVIKVSF